MIVFLTLCYCGLLAVLVKLGVIKWTLWWKLSPLAWMLLLFIVLFIPMQWGAPAGPVNVYQYVVEVIPNVSGEVIEVPVKGLEPLKQGDVLFRIDPVPYQATVDQLKAQLEDTIQNVQQLQAAAEAADATVRKTEADVELFKAEQEAAAATVTAAKAGLVEAQGEKKKVIAVVEDLKVQIVAAKREYDRLKLLAAESAVSKSERDVAEVKLTRLRSQQNTAEVDVAVADDLIERSRADVTVAQANANSVDLRLKQLIETEIPRVRAKAREANLAATSMIGDEHTTVAAVRAQLEKAEFDLEQTTVRAPSDGYVVGMSLHQGQRVTSFPMRSWMSFVPTEKTALAAGIPQYTLRDVEPGQPAEVTLKLYPGRVYSATVDEIAYISAQGQLQPSGTVMTAPGVNQQAVPFTVRLKLDEDASLDLTRLPGGTVGTAAIYTDQAQATHIIRRVMIRMEAWLNYIKPS